MSITESPSAILTRFLIGSQWQDIPDRVRHEGKRALLNFLGAAIGGSRDATIEQSVEMLQRFSGPRQASVIGRSERFDLLNAAFLNAASGNVLDFDDTHHPTVIHPTSPVAPVLLALAESTPLSGDRLLHALILGIEVACRLGNTVSLAHYIRGWHITSTCGVVGAAAAAAKTLQLDFEQTLCALGLGANQACGLVESLGSMAKSVSVGNAARNGLVAAFLAQQGFTAAAQTLEGPRGFAKVTSDHPDLDALTAGLGLRWEIQNNALKPYPNGVVLHSVTDACLALRAEHRPLPEHIARIVVRGNPLLRQRADRPAPHSSREAAVSAQHSAAVCFLFGEAGVAQYTDLCVNDPRVQALGLRVEVEEDASIAVEAAQVRVEMRDGSAHHAHIAHALGSLARPLSDGQVESKVRTLAQPYGKSIAVDALIDKVWHLESCNDVVEVIRCALPQ